MYIYIYVYIYIYICTYIYTYIVVNETWGYLAQLEFFHKSLIIMTFEFVV